MPIPIYTVDAFTDRAFAGNPAAVCFPADGVDDAWLANVAAEMRHSETAFLWPEGASHRLRWMTPSTEIDLCGHATLASAHVLWETGRLAPDAVAVFETRSGRLTATRLEEGSIELDFPITRPVPTEAPAGLLEAFGLRSARVHRSRFDYLLAISDEELVRDLTPNFAALRALDVRGVIVTAASSGDVDFVSRFFAPGSGVDEDPVTGSAHCALAPFWAREVGRNQLVGYQASSRGGKVGVEVVGDRVKLRGQAITVLRGELVV